MYKYLKLLLLFIGVSASINTFSQTTIPDGILFQAVARDANGNAAVARTVYAKVAILKGSATGTSVYAESFQVTSTEEGIFTIVIGKGTRTGGAANLLAVDWSSGIYFMNIKLAVAPTLPDPNWTPTNEYVDLGTSQFWNVPYAFVAGRASVADSTLSIGTIVPSIKGGTGVNNNGKTITIANNIITKGIGDLTITTTAASNVIFPTTGTLATLAGVESLSNKTIISPIITGRPVTITQDTATADSTIATTLFVSKKISALAASAGATAGEKLNLSDTAAMLSNRFARDTVSLSNRINLKADKLNAKIDSSLYVKGKTTITDSLLAKANVLIDSNLFVKGNLRLGGKLLLDSGLKFNDSLIVLRGARIDSSLLVKGKIIINDSLLAKGPTTIDGNLIVKGINILSKSSSDSTLFVNRLVSDSTIIASKIRSDSTTIKTALTSETTRALAAEALKVNLSDTASMLLPYAIRSNTVASINTKVNIADTANMLSLRIGRDTVSLSNRINALSSSASGDLAAEIARATAAENTLTINLAAETTRAKAKSTADSLAVYTKIVADSNVLRTLINTANTNIATNLTKEKSDSLTLASRISSSEINITNNSNDIIANLNKERIDSTTFRNLINVNTSTINTNLLKQQTDSLTLATKLRSDSTNLYAKSVADSTVLRGLINTNINDINTNTTNISNNAINISNNATNIAANTAAINNRVSFTDMPAFLLPYLKIDDTLNMLANYRVAMIDNNARIAALISDTATLITRFSYKENLSNKTTDVNADGTSNVKYPSAKAVKDYVDNAVTVATPDATTTSKGKIQLSGDLTGIAAAPTVSSVGGSSSTTIHTAELLANAATEANTPNTIVKRNASGNFIAGNIAASLTGSVTGDVLGNVTGNLTGNASTATKLAATKNIYGNAFDGSADLTQAIAGTYGGTGVNNGNKTITLGGNILTANDFSTSGNFATTLTTTGATNITLPTTGTIATLAGTETLTNKTIVDLSLTGVPTAPTASSGTNTAQIATTAFVTAATTAATPDASTTVKGKVQLAGDLGGIATAPTVITVGGSSSANINTAELLANAATNANTSSAIVKRDASGNFTAGNITASITGNVTGDVTGNLFGNANTATKLAATKNIYGNAFDGTADLTQAIAGTYGGTGVDNGSKTITLGGNIVTANNFITVGNFNTTLTSIGITNVTLPTTGTLSTIDGTEALTNKTINGLTPTALANGFSLSGGVASKTLTVNNNATLSGTNTGDQTISLTGDVTGTGTGSFAATLANSGVTSGVYGGATSVPTITVDAKGRIISASNTTITGVSSIGSLLESGKIIVGDVSNQAAKVDMSGDVTIDNTGTTTIGANTITTSKISNSNVTYAKIQNVSASNKVLGRVSGSSGGVIEEISTIGTGNVVRAISPVFSGTPKVPTAIYPSNDSTIASTQYVTTAINNISASAVSGILPGANGGTGVDNTGKTITLAGNLKTIGTNGHSASITFITTDSTVLTLPTRGTLATLSDVSGSSIGGSQITGIINPINGGTGVANSNSNSITLGGSINVGANFTTTGTTGSNNSDITLKTTAPTELILPTTGTLVTLAGSETLTNKTIDAALNTITGISNSNLDASANIDDSKLATIATAGKVANSATTATKLNTANAIVSRDANGAFSAGIITASLNGNAGTATQLAATKNIYGNAFNGTADLTAVIASTFGGTGNGFTKFTGPSGSEQTFTLPNASATILTTDALVTVAQGGTGAATATQNFVFAGPATGSSAGAPTFRALTAADLPAGSGSYIANQTTQQASSNFNISGNGVVGGTLSANSLSLTSALSIANGGTGLTATPTSGQIDIGTSSGTFARTNLTAGTGVTITNGNGAITISASGSGGTVTNLSPISVSASGNTFSSTVANASTTPTLSLTIPLAAQSGTTAGLLSNADYATFNAKQTALTLGTGVQTFLATPSSANLLSAITDETGTGTVVFSTNPTITNPTFTTPTLGAATATSITSGTLNLTTPLSVSSGGIGASTATQNFVFAGPATGSTAGAPTFRALTAADLPAGSGSYIANQTTQQATSNFNISGSGVIGTSLTAGTLSLTTALSVANGGTGASTLAANAVLIGNGTGAIQTLAPGTTGNVLVSNGTTWVSQAAPASGVSTVGSISATSNIKGATISGTTITLTPADGTNGGVVTTAAQTFAGTKSFADVNLSGALNGASSATSTIAGFNAALSNVTANITISSANAATYNGKVLVCSGSAFTVTFDSTVPVGFSCMILQSDNNIISFSGASNRYNYTQTSGLYSIATAMCYASGSILLTGDLQ